MTDEEREDIINSLFPVGKERWIKILYLDRDKCMEAFRMYGNDHAKNAELHKEQGYEVTALGTQDEYLPQISAILDIKEQIIGLLYGVLQDHQLTIVNNVFKSKTDELRQRTITTEPAP